MILTPKDWERFQHYKDRSPSWIKLHHSLLDNFDFHCLQVASRALAPMLWLLASEHPDGKIVASPEEIAFRLRMPIDQFVEALSPLIDAGFFDASELLAERYQDASPEKERYREETYREEEEEETETRGRAREADWPANFRDQFWDAYPHKVGKKTAIDKLKRIKRDGSVSFARLMLGLAAYVHDKPPDRPWCNPATWLNQERWDDQPALPIEPRARPLTPSELQKIKTQEVLYALDETIKREHAAFERSQRREDDPGQLPNDHGQRPEDLH